MKTLDEHNADERAKRDALRAMMNRADVACPKCGAEMLYTANAVLTSDPPKRLVICPECHHSGYKLTESC